TSPPLEFSGPSGLAHLAGTAPLNRVDYLSGLSGLLQLEADVSRRGLFRSEVPAWAVLGGEALPEARIVNCLPSRAGLPERPPLRFTLADDGTEEIHRLVSRLRRDGVSLAAVATRLRGWAACQGDVEQVALSHTGRRYVVAVGLLTSDAERHRSVTRT